jgi:deoxyuridine 5'-triphosphate nucleotidohydrolase
MATPNDVPTLRYITLTPNALPPTRRSSLAAGLDLRSAYDRTVLAFGKELVETDLAILLPPGCYGRIAPRSGLVLHRHVSIGGGVINADYRGYVCVIFFNHSITPLYIHRGDRIAQIVCEKVMYPNICEVQELNATERGTGGFGSTRCN